MRALHNCEINLLFDFGTINLFTYLLTEARIHLLRQDGAVTMKHEPCCTRTRSRRVRAPDNGLEVVRRLDGDPARHQYKLIDPHITAELAR